MGQTLTSRVKAIKNDDLENVLVSEINGAFDKFDNHFIPACKIRRNGTQVVVSGSGQNLLNYDTIVYDTYAARSEGPMADLSNDKIIIRKLGLYWVRATTLANAGTAGMLRLDLAVNGVTNNSDFQTGQTTTASSQMLAMPIVLAANDYIQAYVQQTTGSNRTYTNNTYDHIFTLEAIWMGSAVEV